MPRFINEQEDFSSGEISPFLKARSSLDQYKNGLDEMLNFIPSKYGNAVRRPGATYIGAIYHLNEIYESTSQQAILDVHLIPYQITESKSYVMAIVLLSDRVLVQPYYYSGTGLSPVFTLSLFTNYTSISNSLTSIISTTQSIHDFQHTQFGDNLILCHKSGTIPPIVVKLIFDSSGTATLLLVKHLYKSKIVVSGTTIAEETDANRIAWGFPPIKNFLFFPYTDINSTQITLTASSGVALNSSTTITASAAFFNSSMEKSYFKQTISSTTFIWRVDSYLTTTTATCTLVFGSSTASTSSSKLWEFQAWNDYWGHPKTVTTFEQRLIFGGTNKYTDTIWFSAIGNLFLLMQKKLAQDLSSDSSGANFYGPLVDSDPFSLLPSSSQINYIQWLCTLKGLYFGTLSCESNISGVSKAITPTNFQITSDSEIGSAYVQPVKISNSIIYVSKDKKKLYQLRYNLNRGTNTPKDLSLLFGGREYDFIENSTPTNLFAENYKIVQLCYNRSRNTLFSLNRTADSSDGYVTTTITNLVFNDDTDQFGASTTYLASTHEVTSICNAINPFNFKDSLILAVKLPSTATPGANYTFSFQEIHSDYNQSSLNPTGLTSVNDNSIYPYYSDYCYYNTTANHPYLRSVLVDVLCDRVLYEDILLDSSGNFSLPGGVTGSSYIIGMPFTSRIKLLPINQGGSPGNASIVSIKRLDKVWVQYRNSKHITVSTSSDSLKSLELDVALTNTTLYSGVKSKAINSNSSFIENIIISTDKSYPCTILKVGYRGVTEEI